MIARYNLHLVLVRCFQLPIELRFIIIENYFPFLQKERRPLTSTELLEFATSPHPPFIRSTRNFNFMPIEIKDDQSPSQKCAVAFYLLIYDTFIEAMIYRGRYETLYEDGFHAFEANELLYYNNQIVFLQIKAQEITEVNVQKYQQQITNFYRQWVKNVMNGIGSFLPLPNYTTSM